jgi:hypothetical protein
MEPTADNINFLRAIKANFDGHVITISDINMTRTITGAIIINDYEVHIGTDAEIEIEFEGNPAI